MVRQLKIRQARQGQKNSSAGLESEDLFRDVCTCVSDVALRRIVLSSDCLFKEDTISLNSPSLDRRTKD